MEEILTERSAALKILLNPESDQRNHNQPMIWKTVKEGELKKHPKFCKGKFRSVQESFGWK